MAKPTRPAPEPGTAHRGGRRGALLGDAAALAVLLATVLSPTVSQARPHPGGPGAQCLTRYGRTVCGYDCKEAYGLVRCAKSPAGRCEVSYGRVKCWDPPAHPSPRRPPSPPGWQRAQCVRTHGHLVCGFGCAEARGQARCSTLPGGRCWAERGHVRCSEDDEAGAPPPGPFVPPYPPYHPRGMCLTRYGQTICGFDCRAAYGQVDCAKTPSGVCAAAFGRVVCWDPPRITYGWRKAECVARYGRVACGYHCKAAFGQVACAQTPEGVCARGEGRVVCWDPPPPGAPTPRKSE